MWSVAAPAAFVTCLICIRILLSRFNSFALDRPNERSLHVQPVPRSGGLGLLAGLTGSLPFGGAALAHIYGLALVLAAISLWDDVRGIAPGVRLALHVLAACVLTWSAGLRDPVTLAVLVLGTAWLVNLYNFMDGSDGLAGGMSVIGFAAYALAASTAGSVAIAAMASAISAASLAFLFHNFHPARIFLGDVGSIPLGFLAAALGIQGWTEGAWPLWFPILVFGPFAADATVTLMRRVFRGERLWRAHRDHYYQRMIRMGLGHRRTALILYAVMSLCAGAALAGRREPIEIQILAFALGTVVLAGLALWVDWRWAGFRKAGGEAG